MVNTVRPAPNRRNQLLAALPAADLSLLAPHFKEVPLGARELLHETQDEIEQIYFPHSGMVSLLAVTDDGEAIETAAIGSDGVIGASAGRSAAPWCRCQAARHGSRHPNSSAR